MTPTPRSNQIVVELAARIIGLTVGMTVGLLVTFALKLLV
jgi:hypothetical protein